MVPKADKLFLFTRKDMRPIRTKHNNYLCEEILRQGKTFMGHVLACQYNID